MATVQRGRRERRQESGHYETDMDAKWAVWGQREGRVTLSSSKTRLLYYLVDYASSNSHAIENGHLNNGPCTASVDL